MNTNLPPNLKIISLALLASTVLYIVIAFVLASAQGWAWTWALFNPTLLIVLGVLAFALAGASLLLAKLPLLPRLALAEAVAILGLVAAFLTRSPLWVLPFVGLSLLLQVFLSPFLVRSETSVGSHIR
ncbi:MAG TPA: hypothetical protein VJR29_05305 [bacterium]|nr:hypothetical protein [bacterium]